MPTSVRLKPEIEKLLDQACKSKHKNRSTVINEALAEFLKPRRPNLGELFEELLKESPQGFRIKRQQPKTPDKRDWLR